MRGDGRLGARADGKRGSGKLGAGAGRRGKGESVATMEARLVKLLHSRKIVLCNKTDVQPCPLPDIAQLESSTIFLAGSATRGTNMRELWRRVEACAARRS